MIAPGFAWDAADIRAALKKSSFALGALLLRPAQRYDLELFYAFCRAIDDCADDHAPAQAKKFLAAWSESLEGPERVGAALLVREIRSLCARHRIPLSLLHDLILGAQSDLRAKVRFRSHKDLDLYCHRVAGVVGQVCLPLFGMDREKNLEYAETLARGFQLINILRDAQEDAARGRIYFPLEDLRRHGVTEAAFLEGKAPGALYQEAGARAQACLDKAAQLSRGSAPSRLMARLYGALLAAMRRDGYPVFQERYRLGPARKAWILLTGLLP